MKGNGWGRGAYWITSLDQPVGRAPRSQSIDGQFCNFLSKSFVLATSSPYANRTCLFSTLFGKLRFLTRFKSSGVQRHNLQIALFIHSTIGKSLKWVVPSKTEEGAFHLVVDLETTEIKSFRRGGGTILLAIFKISSIWIYGYGYPRLVRSSRVTLWLLWRGIGLIPYNLGLNGVVFVNVYFLFPMTGVF